MLMQFVAKHFVETASESTCHKRVTVCELYAICPGYTEGEFNRAPRILVSRESNRCDPPAGRCARVGLVQVKDNYDTRGCNWTHAEIRALESNRSGLVADTAHVYGHDFACKPCEEALRAAGVKYIYIHPTGPEHCSKAAGLRPVYSQYGIEIERGGGSNNE